MMTKWDIWTSTVRAPTSNDTSALSNNSWVAMTLDQNLASFQQRLYALFSNYPNYTTWSNEAWIPDLSNSSYDSIESLHDTIHNIAGGLNGHMAYIPFSAFDPIFFLHHAMIDRVFAMWQALYPHSWITPQPAVMNSYTTSVGQMQDSTTPLTPFYADENGTFWNSDMIRDPSVLGYSYAELSGSPGSSGRSSKGVQSRVRSAVNRLYGGSSPASLAVSSHMVKKMTGGLSVEQEGQSTSTESDADAISRENPPASILANNRYHEWIANIRVDKQALGGPFSIHFFLDGIPKKAKMWAYAPGLVGTMSVFAAPNTLHAAHRISGTVPLTASLAKKVQIGILPSLDPAVVVHYLKHELRFAVRSADGAIFNPEDVDGLHIHVASSEVTAPSREDELPSWGETITHYDLV
jgi:tyrosinase